MLWLVSFVFSKEEEEEEEDEEEEEHGQSVKIMFACISYIPPVIFSSNFLLVVTFSHVLHLDALRRQIESEN